MSDISIATKGKPQRVPGKSWQTLWFVDAKGNKFTQFHPAAGRCEITAQLYAGIVATGRPTYIKVRILRVGTNDPTAYDTIALPPRLRPWSTVFTTFMQTQSDNPLAIQIYHDGTQPVVFGNRIVKMDVN